MKTVTEKRWVVMVDYPGGTISHRGESLKAFVARIAFSREYVRRVTLTYQVPK